MEYGEKGRTAPRPHSLALDKRTALTVTGVEDVGSFDEQTIVMTTSGGRLIVRGSELHMEKLSLENGEVVVQGRVDGLDYEDAPAAGGFFARLFR